MDQRPVVVICVCMKVFMEVILSGFCIIFMHLCYTAVCLFLQYLNLFLAVIIKSEMWLMDQ
jgi:hypothetical protein